MGRANNLLGALWANNLLGALCANNLLGTRWSSAGALESFEDLNMLLATMSDPQTGALAAPRPPDVPVQRLRFGQTSRKDTWWVGPALWGLLFVVGFGYLGWGLVQPHYYWAPPY